MTRRGNIVSVMGKRKGRALGIMEEGTGEGHLSFQLSCAGLGRGSCGPTEWLSLEGMVLSPMCRPALAIAKYFNQAGVRKQTVDSILGESVVLYTELQAVGVQRISWGTFLTYYDQIVWRVGSYLGKCSQVDSDVCLRDSNLDHSLAFIAEEMGS